MRKKSSFVFLLLVLSAYSGWAQSRVTSPVEQFGFNVGADYQLVNYSRLLEYWRKLDQQSDRLSLAEIGRTAEGRPIVMAIVTSPENQKLLARYKETARKLALAQGITDDEAHALAREGKAVVWIDGGLHATEVLGSQQLIELVYQMVSMSDPETVRILKDDIILATCVNPDGLELVADWYMRETEPTKRSMSDLPRLYHRYIGHDNNRDFYISNQPETEAINRVFYFDWFPQIIYNHHQTGPAGTVLFAPPFRDPFNYYFDPLVPMGIDLVSAAMHNRFVAEGKPGATMRSGSSYSTWWNGGLRTTAYFHNMIGLLTEAIGNPTPVTIPLVLQNQLPRQDLPVPIPPQPWHFRQSIDYAISADRAVLDIASKYREEFLFNIYRMGKNSIERGSRDNWTVHPRVVQTVEAALARERGTDSRPAGSGRGRSEGTAPPEYYEKLHDPALRDPRGFIIPSDQADFLTATKFVNALIKTGIVVHRATDTFAVAGKTYPAGSYVVKTAQAFRPHILDMFEPQDHPDDIPYPGGPPRPPYDNAGWTLAFQMGVAFTRVLDGFDGPFEPIRGFAQAPAGTVRGTGAAGYLLSHRLNDSFVAINRLLGAGEDVYWLKRPVEVNGQTQPPGTIFIPQKASTAERVSNLSASLGLSFDALTKPPQGDAMKLRPVRIGLWDRYGGSMPSGWVRWLLEKFEFPFELVYVPALDAGNLADRYDVLIFVTGAIPPPRSTRDDAGPFTPEPDRSRIPAEYHDRIGAVSQARTIPQLKKFVEDGGTLLAVGTSTAFATHVGLPVGNALVEKLQNGSERPLARDKYYVPGSILEVRVDTSNPIAYGLPEYVDVFFDNSPVFRLGPDAALRNVRPVSWFDSKQPLRSGWAWGQGYLDQGVTAVEAELGKGRVVLFGPEITFRGQPHGTFKFLFNGIYYGKAQPANLPAVP